MHNETLPLPIHKHLQLHTHNTNRKNYIHHISYTNTQHTSTLRGLKSTLFNNGHYTTNMCHIHTYIVSCHLASRGNNKILRTPAPHISSSEDILPASLVAPLAIAEQINLISSNHTYTKSTQHPHTHHVVTPGFVGRPC